MSHWPSKLSEGTDVSSVTQASDCIFLRSAHQCSSDRPVSSASVAFHSHSLDASGIKAFVQLASVLTSCPLRQTGRQSAVKYLNEAHLEGLTCCLIFKIRTHEIPFVRKKHSQARWHRPACDPSY